MPATVVEALHSITTRSAIDYAVQAKKHSLGIAMGALGILAFRFIHKSLARATALSHVPGPEAPSIIWGHINEMHDPVNGVQMEMKLLKTYGTTCRVKGLMSADDLWTADPRALNEVLVKNADVFHQSPNFALWMAVVLGETLINANAQTHKLLRKLMNPAFSPKHMRDLVPTIGAIASRLEDVFRSQVQEAGQPSTTIDVYHWCHCVGLEMIGQAAMGHSFRLMEGEEPPYIKAAGQLFPTVFAAWYIRPFLPLLVKMGPKRFQRFVVKHTPIQTVQDLKNISDLMHDVGVNLLKQKQEAAANGTLHAQVAAGKDIMTLLFKQNEILPPGEQMSDAELATQVNSFLFAGSDTTSGAVARIIHLLSLHQDVQDTLRAEISKAFQTHGSDLDYDQLNSLTYLEAVCREALRLFSPVLLLERVAQKDWVIPLHYPIKAKDGKAMITEVSIKKGANIYLSLAASNRNKVIWGDDADEFKPSRWLGELPSEVQNSKYPGIYSSMMTFGGGPHACIGFKFTQIEIKVIITKLVNSFKFEPASGTRINWESDGVVKPYAYSPDGTKSPTHSMPLKVSLV
uniref:Cytochrome P450 n=1 Tax=Thanatephorus cucumeris TaxID=107832 RepID=A0A2R4RMZ2_THACU|nr:cytochrome P450 [Thanatephorus cucumeris]